MIKLYNQLLTEMTARFSNIRKSDEPNGLSGRSLRTKEEEYDLLKVFSFYCMCTGTISKLYMFILETNSRCTSSIKERTTIDYFFLVRPCAS